MPKKSFLKKKAHQKHCRDMVKAGRINNEAGDWIQLNETAGIAKNMHSSMRHGYRL